VNVAHAFWKICSRKNQYFLVVKTFSCLYNVLQNDFFVISIAVYVWKCVCDYTNKPKIIDRPLLSSLHCIKERSWCCDYFSKTFQEITFEPEKNMFACVFVCEWMNPFSFKKYSQDLEKRKTRDKKYKIKMWTKNPVIESDKSCQTILWCKTFVKSFTAIYWCLLFELLKNQILFIIPCRFANPWVGYDLSLFQILNMNPGKFSLASY